MSEENDERLCELLRQAMGPADRELKRDLWPRMLRGLDERPVQVPWFDWVLIALVPVWFFFFPETIPVLLYYL